MFFIAALLSMAMVGSAIVVPLAEDATDDDTDNGQDMGEDTSTGDPGDDLLNPIGQGGSGGEDDGSDSFGDGAGDDGLNPIGQGSGGDDSVDAGNGDDGLNPIGQGSSGDDSVDAGNGDDGLNPIGQGSGDDGALDDSLDDTIDATPIGPSLAERLDDETLGKVVVSVDLANGPTDGLLNSVSVATADWASSMSAHELALADQRLIANHSQDADGDGNALGLGLGTTNGVVTSVGHSSFDRTDNPNWNQALDGDDVILMGENGRHLSGGMGDDLIIAAAQGGDGQNGQISAMMHGGGDNDVLIGSHGHDVISGGSGNDVLFGGGGSDTLSGNSGADTIFAGAGDDNVTGGQEGSVIFGGDGNDQIKVYAGGVADGGMGRDIIREYGNTGTPGEVTVMVGTVLEMTENGIVDRDDEWDILNPTESNSIVFAGNADYVSLGAGADTVVTGDWVDNEEVRIANFEEHQDKIVIVYDDSDAMPTLEVEPHPQHAGHLSIMLNGESVAAVKAAAEELTVADITLMPYSAADLSAAMP